MAITITLPKEYRKVLIKKNQKVDFGEPIAKKHLERQVSIPLAKQMKVAPHKIYMILKKVIGDIVTRGELLAEKKELLSKKQYLSDYDGIIKAIDSATGDLILSIQAETEETMTSFFKGKVIEVTKDEIEVEITGGAEFPIAQATGDFGGEVTHIQSEIIQNIDEDHVAKKIVITEKIPTYEHAKLEALQSNGLVTLLEGVLKTSSLPSAFIKNKADWEKIAKLTHPYCIVSTKHSKIVFYR